MALKVASPDEPVKKTLALPVLVSSPVDIGRLLRELAEIDEGLLQLTLRKSGSEIKMPKTSQLMDQVIVVNKLNLLHEVDRKLLQQFLQFIKDKAPVIHMSFSADPSVAFMEKLMSWLRKEIHPQVLVTVGLQPNIGAGCVVRTINHQFDFSLKQDFDKKRDMLLASLSAKEVKA